MDFSGIAAAGGRVSPTWASGSGVAMGLSIAQKASSEGWLACFDGLRRLNLCKQ